MKGGVGGKLLAKKLNSHFGPERTNVREGVQNVEFSPQKFPPHILVIQNSVVININHFIHI